MIDKDATPLTREDREELATAAINADRRNTPMGFLLLGGMVLGLGLVLLVTSWVSLRGAKARWNEDAARVTKIQRLATEFDALTLAANDTSNISAFEPNTSMLTDLDRLATQSDVTVKVPKTTYQSTMNAGTRVALFGYTGVKDDSLADLLGWVKSTTGTIPGMRVDLIKLTLPANTATTTPTQWEMDVTFARTELAQ
ncbi:MAG: hypothetical protein ACI89L_002848 [Phycisphaerales bacterium]